jgi:hypothetical protein
MPLTVRKFVGLSNARLNTNASLALFASSRNVNHVKGTGSYCQQQKVVKNASNFHRMANGGLDTDRNFFRSDLFPDEFP